MPNRTTPSPSGVDSTHTGPLPLRPGQQAQYLFEHIRTEGARAFGERLRRTGALNPCLPLVGGEAAQALNAWFEALDRWQYTEGNLTPTLCFTSRIWALLRSQGAATETAATQESVQRLLTLAFPALRGAGAPLAQLGAVIIAQARLDIGDSTAWVRWPAPMRQEALRLMKWRELQGERPMGHAARCYAALRHQSHGQFVQAPTPHSADPKVESHDAWRHGQRPLADAPADVHAPEFVLVGAGVRHATEVSETAVACLAVLCRLQGHDVKAIDLAAEVPISNEGISLRDWLRLCRRVGLGPQVRQRPFSHQGLDARPAFLRLRDGTCLLVLEAGRVWCRAYVPGLGFPFRWLRTDELAADGLDFWCDMTHASGGKPKARPCAAPAFYVLPHHRYALGFANPEALFQLHSEAARWRCTSALAPRLRELSLAGLMEAHRSLGTEGSPLHGTFRRVNLHGCRPMVVWQQVPQAMDDLFRHVDALPRQGQASSLIDQVSAVFTDYLTVHPFINGNRRTAMALAAALFAHRDLVLDLSGISRIEVYHAVRCAVAGHPRPLKNLFARNLSGALTCESN